MKEASLINKKINMHKVLSFFLKGCHIFLIIYQLDAMQLSLQSFYHNMRKIKTFNLINPFLTVITVLFIEQIQMKFSMWYLILRLSLAYHQISISSNYSNDFNSLFSK